MLQAEQLLLPRHEQLLFALFVDSNRFERASGSDERGLDLQLPRGLIATPSQFSDAPIHFQCRSQARSPPDLRPFTFRRVERLLRRGQKFAPPSRRKMAEFRRLARVKRSCREDELLILQNVKRRTICRARFAIAPMPECAQNRRGPAAQRAGTCDSPQFVIIALALHARLCDRAIARFAEPFQAISLD